MCKIKLESIQFNITVTENQSVTYEARKCHVDTRSHLRLLIFNHFKWSIYMEKWAEMGKKQNSYCLSPIVKFNGICIFL